MFGQKKFIDAQNELKKQGDALLSKHFELTQTMCDMKYKIYMEIAEREAIDKARKERSEMAVSLVSCVTGRDEYEIAARAVKLADAIIAELKK